MSYITEEEFQSAFAGWDRINTLLQKFADEYVSVFGKQGAREYVTSVTIDGGMIDIKTEASSCSCCSPDYDSYCLPLEYLWNDWRVTEKVAREEQNRRKQEEEKRKKEAEEIARKHRRYEQYLAMKKEFETK